MVTFLRGLTAVITLTLLGPVALASDNPRIHRYTAGPDAWNTNSYIVEGQEGVVLIDAQLLKSDAAKFAAIIEEIGKPVLGAVITHPHLDHFGGLNVLQARLGAFPTYASAETRAHLDEVQTQMLGFYGSEDQYGADLERSPIGITDEIVDGQSLTLGDLSFHIDDIGPGEAQGAVLIYLESAKALFAGDTFYPHQHFYLGEGRPSKVLEQLNFIKDQYADVTFIYSGHGNPSRPHVVDGQIAYVELILAETKAALAIQSNLDGKGHLTRDARSKIVDKVLSLYPTWEDFGLNARQIVAGNIFGAELELKGNAP